MNREPVLMATCGYVVGADFDWDRGLSHSARRAPRFYAVLLVAVVLGSVISFTGVPPIRLLFISSIVGGVGTPVGLVYLLLVAGNTSVMREHRVGLPFRLLGWGVAALVAAASITVLVQQLASL